jgi:hypothetical protein
MLLLRAHPPPQMGLRVLPLPQFRLLHHIAGVLRSVRTKSGAVFSATKTTWSSITLCRLNAGRLTGAGFGGVSPASNTTMERTTGTRRSVNF